MFVESGDIAKRTFLRVVDDDVTLDGLIDDHSVVVVVSTGSITVRGKIDNHSNVTLRAATDVVIGTTGNPDDDKIDGNSNVTVIAGGNFTLGGYVHKATADFRAHGGITMGEVDDGATVRLLADRDVSIKGQINGSDWDHGPSRVEVVSNRGTITVDGEIHGKSNVYLTAGTGISLGSGPGGPYDIDDFSFVTAIAGGDISLGGGIRQDHTTVDFAAAGRVTIGKGIEDKAVVRLASGAGSITVTGAISPTVTSFPVGALVPTSGTPPLEQEWADPGPLAPTTPRSGYWWENWGQTFGYVAPFRVVPRSVDDIVKAVIGDSDPRRPDLTAVKAVGGGWSFTDAVLPFRTQAEVDQASLLARGTWQQEDVRHLLEGRTDDTCVRSMDLLPQAVTRNVAFSTMYDQHALRQVTNSGAQLPASADVRLIDTRSMASSLQCQFDEISAPDAGVVGAPLVGTTASRPRRREILFHVEAGITMADLQQLLDHQHPRLALLASGGSPGATLAGSLSTATHGGEFKWPLLVDCVRAVHLIGPGGVQWWIEGDVPVADPAKLQQRYGAINVIRNGWSDIPGLTAQDVLKAVVVSMGTMGVVYSMVLQVFPQFGLRQVVHPTTWSTLLAAAGTSEQALRSGDTGANQLVLDALIKGDVNGTGIHEHENVYVDLAVNPFKRTSLLRPDGDWDCWVVNRKVTGQLPDDANSPAAGVGDYMSALISAQSGATQDSVGDSRWTGRIFDFLSYATDIGSINLSDTSNAISQAGRLMGFITGSSDAFGSALAAINAQVVLDAVNHVNEPYGGLPFLRDGLTGFFHALEGTTQAESSDGVTAAGLNSDHTAVSYKVGAIGWPDGGLPGRGLEIALDPSNAFTFLQTVLFDDVLTAATTGDHPTPLVGYISVRICRGTETLLGMQQFRPHSVMIEVVAYSSPESATIMNLLQHEAKRFGVDGQRPLLHWGLENDQLDAGYLATTPLGQPYRPGMSRLDAFRKIRDFLRGGHAPVFDNNFTARLGL